MNADPFTRRPLGSRCARGRHATVSVIAALVLVGAAGCDQDILEGGMGVDNRTGQDLTVYTSVEKADGTVQEVRKGSVESGQRRALAGGSCSTQGIEARTDDGTVVATLPPRSPSDVECDIQWVITEDDSWIEPP